MSSPDQQQLWELSQGRSDTTEGYALDVDWGERLVEVNINGIIQRMPWFGPPPWPGDRVRVITAGTKPFAQLIQGAPMGTVQSVAAGVVVALGDDGRRYDYPHLGAAPASGARVRLDHAGRVVTGVYSTEPAGSDVAPAPPLPPAGGGSAEFAPAWSGNWSSGAFGGDLVTISTSRTGAYGYGTQIRDTVPDGATITRAELRLSSTFDRYPGEVIGFGTHGFDGRPGSLTDGSLAGVYTAGGSARAIDIRGAVADALKTGAALGIGFYSSSAGPYGWREFDRAPVSGRIYMEWS